MRETRCIRSISEGYLAEYVVKALDEELDRGEDSDEIYVVNNIAAVTLDDTQLVTLRLTSRNFLRFQAGTGAQCNVIFLHLYNKAANDLRFKI